MKTVRLSATEARNNFFTLLNQVIYENLRVVITKAGSTRSVELLPSEEEGEAKEKRLRYLNETYGVMKNIPKKEFFDKRLRGKQAKAYLDQIRKGNV